MTFIDKNQVGLKELIALKRQEYKMLQPIECRMRRETVHFTFDGFEHLHMNGRNRRRNPNDAYTRLLLMEHAPSVIYNSRFIKEDTPKMKQGKVALHYELYGKVGSNNKSVVVTLRRLGNSKLHFYGIRYK